MYYEDLIDSAVNDETSVEFKLRQIQTAEAVKKLDKHYEKIIVPFNKAWTDGKYYKFITIENYGSGTIGTRIRNAVTGVKENFMVGSADEDLFFKVTDSTGRYGRKDPLILYYDSPEQFENHHFTTVNQDIKNRWYEKNLAATRRMRSD